MQIILSIEVPDGEDAEHLAEELRDSFIRGMELEASYHGVTDELPAVKAAVLR